MAAELIRAVICHVQIGPDQVAVRESNGLQVTRGEIFRRAIGTAKMLDDSVPADATVMLHGPGGAAFWSGLLAVLGTGRRLLHISNDLPERDRFTLAKAHGVDAILETSPEHGAARGHDVRLHTGVAPEEDGGESILARGKNSSLLLRSSGTSGSPSVALRPGPALDHVVGTLVNLLDLQATDRVVAALPMQHAYGLEHAVLAPMVTGAMVAWRPGFDLNWALAELNGGATVFPGLPVTLEACARAEPVADHDLRLAYSAGSPLPPTVRTAFAETWGTPVGDLYGATELGTITWGLNDVARPVPGVSVLVSTDGKTSQQHGEGELLVKSNAMFDGYLREGGGDVDPGVRLDDHLRTGDLGRIEEDGSVEITGRIKAQFDVGGLKVNPADVEKILQGQPGVSEIAVLPLLLSETVTRVLAVVVAEKQGIDEDAEARLREGLFTRSAKMLAPHQRPRVIHFRDSLPRTASGKLLRQVLLDEENEHHPA